MEGTDVGISDGTVVGTSEGISEGISDGNDVGAFDGAGEGAEHHCVQAIASPSRPGIANRHLMGAPPLTKVLGGVAALSVVVALNDSRILHATSASHCPPSTKRS
jgi:hypothetical protein